MKVLFVHPGSLMYSELYLRLEPLGLELIAQACRQAGHDVRIIDLQVFRPDDYFRLVEEWRPQAVGFSLNYLANIPQVVDLSRETRETPAKTWPRISSEKPFSYSAPSASWRKPSRSMWTLFRKPSMWQPRTVMLLSGVSLGAWM